MITPALIKNNIFPIDIGEHLQGRPGELFMLYSPLAGKLVKINLDELKSLEEYIGDPGSVDGISGETRFLAEDLLKYELNSGYAPPGRSPGELTKLSILPNYTCNFSCSYCYAASGRSHKIMEKGDVKTVIDFFIDPGRLKGRNLYLALLGGGEPLLSWEVVEFAVAYARERARISGFSLDVGLTTNGSIINDDIISFLKKHDVIVSISFEILEDVQDSQRQQYRQVCGVIDRLIESNVEITFKSMITNLNVNRLEEMVRELICRFPSVKKLKLQPVEDNAIFKNAEELSRFYQDFTNNFFRARKLGEKHGVDVYCNAYKNINFLLEHYCGGELCLTPQGTISFCHRVSSPQEDHYDEFIYGKIDGEKRLTFDVSKFARHMAHDINHKAGCRQCFARWHCGGGCVARAYTYNEEKLDVICNWTRDFYTQILLDRLIQNSGSTG